jgi:nicotinate-nucleotide adenylyltransferase
VDGEAGGRAARVGILGGTFNPPHVGHLACARQALLELGLDRVLLVPTRIPPHKTAEQDPGPEHRLQMCRLAAAGEDGVEVCDLELRRPGPSYTVDTLKELHERDPGAELSFIVGGDVARTFPEWHEPERILDVARLAVIEREDAGREEITRALAPLHPGERLRFLNMPPIDISSSMVRDRIREGAAIDDLVPLPVARYIAREGLYREGAERGTPARLQGARR